MEAVTMGMVHAAGPEELQVLVPGGGPALRTMARNNFYNGPWNKEEENKTPPKIWKWSMEMTEQGVARLCWKESTNDTGLEELRADLYPKPEEAFAMAMQFLITGGPIINESDLSYAARARARQDQCTRQRGDMPEKTGYAEA